MSSITVRRTLAVALVLAPLDYGNALLTGATQKIIERYEKVIRSVVRYIGGLKKYDNTEQHQKDLHILGARDRAKFKVMLLTWKTLHLNEPKILVDLIPKRKLNSKLRSSTDAYKVGHIKRFATKTTKSRFGYACQIFNELPQSIRSIKDIDRFKKQLKTFLFPK